MMQLSRLLCLVLFLGLAFSCSQKITRITSTAEMEQVATNRSSLKKRCRCALQENHDPLTEPEELQKMVEIRVNYHFVNNTEGTQNFTGDEAVQFARNLNYVCNEEWRKNRKMNLPEGNDTPVLDTRVRMRLQKDPNTKSGYAVYEVRNDSLCYYVKKGRHQNNYDRTITKMYAKNDSAVLNIFVMPTHPDSLKSKTYSNGVAGIALGSSVKIAGVNEMSMGDGYKFSGLLNHELGHVMGLRHAWTQYDGCDDTPAHPNCWSKSKNCPVLSNNMMDYNPWQKAVTPCQISIIHRNASRPDHKIRNLMEKSWCEYDPTRTLVFTEDTEFDQNVDLFGDMVIEEGVSVRLSCDVHFPRGAKLIVKPGGHLLLNACTLYNDCGEVWEGIELQKKGKKVAQVDYKGKVTILNTENSDALD